MRSSRISLVFCGWVALVTHASPLQGAVLSSTIGDNDGFGVGISDNQTIPLPSSGMFDNRSTAESSASNSAQFTDHAPFPGLGPFQREIPLPGTVVSGNFSVDVGMVQANIFGEIPVYFNGIQQSGLLNLSQGGAGSQLLQAPLSNSVIAKMNNSGQFIFFGLGANSSDVIAFDYFQVNADLRGPVVPEPSAVAIWPVTPSTNGVSAEIN